MQTAKLTARKMFAAAYRDARMGRIHLQGAIECSDAMAISAHGAYYSRNFDPLANRAVRGGYIEQLKEQIAFEREFLIA